LVARTKAIGSSLVARLKGLGLELPPNPRLLALGWVRPLDPRSWVWNSRQTQGLGFEIIARSKATRFSLAAKSMVLGLEL